MGLEVERRDKRRSQIDIKIVVFKSNKKRNRKTKKNSPKRKGARDQLS
jgi:hypothetical protein